MSKFKIGKFQKIIFEFAGIIRLRRWYALRRVTEIIGLPVINLNSGEKIGEVDDVIFIPISKEIKGVLVKNKNKYFVPNHNIHKIGEDAIIINNRNALQKFNKTFGIGIKNGDQNIIGEKVITKSGSEKGMISDLVIDENKQILIGYELSEGIIQDLLEGRNILSIEQDLYFGEDTLILDDEGG